MRTNAQEDELTRNITVEVNNEKFNLVLVDTNFMHDEFQDSSKSDIIESADAYVVVYAIDDKSTFTTAHSIVNYLLGKCKRSSAILLVANKSDLVRTRAVSSDGSQDTAKTLAPKCMVMVVKSESESEGKNLAAVYSCPFYEISTSLNHRVDELLVGIITEIEARHMELEKERDRLDKMATTNKRGSTSHPGHRRSFVVSKSPANSVFKFFQKHFSRKDQKTGQSPY
ncbi:unnamed protein product [Echinostoma caproni]|uniref:GTP-binding protein RAD n=1 Tax=Echinostoma caproni TaxID=27848 RepID=A0A183A6Y2_9TREM|nr:unnamed protein product [Echinostoma caproni]